MRIAVIQMNSTDQVEQNLQTAAQAMAQAKAAGTDLVVLPENFACMAKVPNHQNDIAENDGEGPIQAFLQQQAQSLKLWIVGGTIPIRDGHLLYATCPIYNPEGHRVCFYRKVHLFDVLVGASEQYQESAIFAPGQERQIFSTPWGLVGVAICYDIRFPELFRAPSEPLLWVVPAAFTRTTGEAHFEVLLRARAIENLSFVAAAAQVGQHVSGRQTYGHSMIINPWGEILSQQSEQPGVVTATLDLARQTALREQFPVLKHRRFHTC